MKYLTLKNIVIAAVILYAIYYFKNKKKANEKA